MNEGTENMESLAASNNSTSRKVHKTLGVMLNNGRLLEYWKQRGNTIFEMDVYGGILYDWTLGKHCYFVNRERVTTVTETFTIVER